MHKQGKEHFKTRKPSGFVSFVVILAYVKVSFRVLRHFTHKASVRSIYAEAIVHSADWLMRVFVNELAPPHARS